jgi:hypothetical protein
METLYLNKDKIQLSESFINVYEGIEDARRRHNQSIQTYQEAPKADFISKEDEKMFFEQYTQKQLSVDDKLIEQNN